MTWMRLPLFVWAMEIYAALLIVVLPALSAGLTMLLLDRAGLTRFFLPAEAATRSSTSTSSGSSATPRST